MTVVVFDGKTVCTDRSAEAMGVMRSCHKMRKLADGSVLAICGGGAHGFAVMDWVAGGADPKNYPRMSDNENAAHVWRVYPDGHFICYEQSGYAIPFLDLTFAAGSGRDFAIGAMAMGADAVKAVQIACDNETTCGNGYDCYTLGD